MLMTVYPAQETPEHRCDLENCDHQHRNRPLADACATDPLYLRVDEEDLKKRGIATLYVSDPDVRVRRLQMRHNRTGARSSWSQLHHHIPKPNKFRHETQRNHEHPCTISNRITSGNLRSKTMFFASSKISSRSTRIYWPPICIARSERANPCVAAKFFHSRLMIDGSNQMLGSSCHKNSATEKKQVVSLFGLTEPRNATHSEQRQEGTT